MRRNEELFATWRRFVAKLCLEVDRLSLDNHPADVATLVQAKEILWRAELDRRDRPWRRVVRPVRRQLDRLWPDHRRCSCRERYARSSQCRIRPGWRGLVTPLSGCSAT